MRLDFQGRWLRLLIEFYPVLPGIRRYRISPVRLENQTERLLRRQIARKLRGCDQRGSTPPRPQ